MKKISLPESPGSSARTKGENHFSTERKHEFESLVTPHLNSLYSTAFRLTHNQNDAEDMTRDTLDKAFQEFDLHQKITDFKFRSFSILINKYFKAYQKSTNRLILVLIMI